MAVDLLDVSYYRATNPDLAQNGIVTDEQARNHFFVLGLEEGRSFSRIVNLGVYRASNPDLPANGVDTNTELYNHLATAGVMEGRRFSPFFDLNFYRANAPDLSAFSNESLFTHAQNSGVSEGRRTSALVDLDFYRRRNGDLQAAFDPLPFALRNLSLFDHLQSSGVREGRAFSPYVDLNFYLEANNDLVAAFGTNQLAAFQHLQIAGISEGRKFSPFVDLNIYKLASPDLRAGNLSNQALIDHLSRVGIEESRRLSISYDPVFYRNRNADLTSLTGLGLLEHFEFAGIGENENRVASDSFDANFYRATNPDLAGFTRKGVLNHFERAGFKEGLLSQRGAGSNEPLAVSFEPGNDLASAANLGVISARRSGSINDSINSTIGDRTDTYRFLLPTLSSVNFRINGFSDRLGVRLIYDRNGNTVFNPGSVSQEDIFSPGANFSPVNFSRTLGEGTYYLQVFNTDLSSSINTSYSLNLTADTFTTNPPDFDPGNTLFTATNLFNGQTVVNFLGATDEFDVYRFDLNTFNTVTFQLENFGRLGSDDIVLELISDANGNGIIDSNEILTSRSTETSLTLQETLGPGGYFIRARRQQFNGNAGYSLNLSLTGVSLSSGSGNTLASALDLGTLGVGTRTLGEEDNYSLSSRD